MKVDYQEFFETQKSVAYYLLGCFMSDGNLSIYKGCYKVKLSSKDKDWLEDIQNKALKDFHLYKLKKQELYELRKGSKVFGEWLHSHGCIPKKSLQTVWPSKLPSEYNRDFMRGLIDGDGSIGLYKGKERLNGSISLCSGSERFIREVMAKMETDGFKLRFEQRVKPPSKYSQKGGVIYYANLDNAETKHLAKWLYYDEDLLCLKRKKANAMRIQELYKANKSRSEFERIKENANALKKAGRTRADIAKDLDVSEAVIKKYTRGTPKPVGSPTQKTISRQKNIANAYDLYNQGKPFAEIALILNVSITAVYSYLKQIPKKDNNDKIAIVQKLRAEGLSLELIAEKTGYPRSFIKSHIKGVAYEHFKGLRAKISNESLEIMKVMFAKGLNNQEIQKQMQFSISAIKQYRRKWKNGEKN